MIQNRYWHRLPSVTTLGALNQLRWSRDGELSPASSTVALMLYVALHFMGEDVTEDGPLGIPLTTRIAAASYEDLMHAIGGVDRPTDGKVLIDNQDIYQLSDEKLAIFRRRQVGLIYQFYNLIPILTVEENIKLPLLLDHQKVDDDKFNELVRQLGIDDRLNHLPNQLSGGQQQRVSIGRSLIYSPAIVLADEPTGNLDSDASREIVELLIDSNQRLNQTILIITHDERSAMRAKRILALKDGKIVRDERVRK